MGFKENLKAELEYKGLKIKELAEISGVKRRTIDHYLTANPQEPSVTNAVLIARALGVSVEYLVTGRDSSVQDSVKAEVVDLVREMSRLSESDLRLARDMVERLRIPIR